jgi:L-ascorbate metabolism protein UlaG (beta-lactamase superfamily)
MSITLVGHSTVLIETGGLRILTDPYFGTWGNPAYARVRPPGLTREEVGPLDVVLVSHNHWDHTDRRFLRSMDPGIPVLAPSRAAWVTRLKGARNVVGIKPWTSWTIGKLEVHAVPALHMATSVGYVIRGDGKTIYFAGDTYHRPFMREIRSRFRPDVALMPVTTYRIPMTMGEKGAVKAAVALGVSVVIPIHLALQPRSPLLRTRETPEGFARRMAEVQPSTQVVLLGEGESWGG